MSFESDLTDAWFDSIKMLDDRNRLKHGKVYASDGSVKEFQIDRNVVTSRIEGAPGDFYDVKIEFKKLSKSDKDKLNRLIKKNSQLQLGIMESRIPEELFFDNVKIIPDSLKDFRMTCTCKNEGLFCKHKATLFHYLKGQISKNPFLIFTLRDYSPDEAFDSKKGSIKEIDDLFGEKAERGNGSAEMDDIPLLINDLKFLLDERTGFFSSSTISFKSVLIDTLKEFSILINRINNRIVIRNTYRHFINFGDSFQLNTDDLEYIFQKKWFHPEKWEKFHIDISGNYDINAFDTGLPINFKIRNLKHALFALFAEFQYIGADIADYNGDLKFLHDVYMLTSKLISKNALIPEFFRLKNGEYAVRWIPSFNNTVSAIVENMACRCPQNLISYNGKVLSGYDQVVCLISLFFNGFTYYASYNLKSSSMKTMKSNIYFQLFFFKSQTFNVAGAENTINAWLSPIFEQEIDFHFLLDVSQENSRFAITPKAVIGDECFDLADIISSNEYPAVIRSSKIISKIFSRYKPDINLNERIILDIDEFITFNSILISVFRYNGIEVTLPEELSIDHEAKLSLAGDSEVLSKTSLTLDDLNRFDWKIAVGDETFSLTEFENLSHSYSGLVKINNRYMKVNPADLDNIDRQTDLIPINPTRNDLMHFILSGDVEKLDIGINDRLSDLIDGLFDVEEIEIPDSFNGKLRKYQERGFSWLYQNMKIGFGSILADDMGLGKTIQVLATILYLKENDLIDGDILIIVPTSLLSNWQKEIEKFTPSLTSFIYHGIDRRLPDEKYDIILTSYGMVRQDFEVIDENLNIFLCVVDEAQNIKNPNSQQTKAIKLLETKHRMALSGTPIENRLSEYWSIFDFINKGYLYSLRLFNENYVKPIENDHDEVVLNSFKKITSPFILRRHKTDKNIIRDLPEKIVNDIYCNLTLKQAAMYEETLNTLIRDVEGSEGINRKGLILKLITSLKQICNHPAQFSKSDKMSVDESGKMEVLISILETILDNDEKVIIFTQYVKMGEILKKLIEKQYNQEVLFFSGSLSCKKRDEMVDKFQNSPENKIMVLSLKAGGTGLNLTAAQNVIHYDLWWNPAVENQATDRAYRIGQENNVMVYRFITTGTFEERINQIISEKIELAEVAIDSNESFITEMNNSDLKEMLRLRKLD